MLAAAVDTLMRGIDAVVAVDPDGLGIAEQLRLLDNLETARRRLTAVSHPVARSAATADAPAVMTKAIADAIRVSPAEARRRLRDAEQLAARTALCGEPLPARLPATAAAWNAGMLDGEHVRVIQKFLRDLPAHIATATIQDLQAKTGHAVTASGTRLPITDLIRMATHAYHYLNIFDGVTGRALWLGRTKRIATADQRLVLHAKDRGCTHPGCDMPGYLCEVHHITDWAQGGPTDIDNLTFACPPHHKLLDQGWRTTTLTNGQTQWIPPPQLELPSTTNKIHHPERFFDD